MRLTNLLKELKKRFRTRRRWLSLGMIALFAGAVLAGSFRQDAGPERDSSVAALSKAVLSDSVPSMDTSERNERLREIARLSSARLVMKTIYVCGEETVQTGIQRTHDILKAAEDHPNARIDLSQDGEVTFTDTVNDLSPRCKENAYFGLDKEGNLSLFEGVPADEHVRRTFYQLNIERMKSSLPQDTIDQLYRGIRVTDLAEFNSVLSTFGEYALTDSDQAAAAPQ